MLSPDVRLFQKCTSSLTLLLKSHPFIQLCKELAPLCLLAHAGTWGTWAHARAHTHTEESPGIQMVQQAHAVSHSLNKSRPKRTVVQKPYKELSVCILRRISAGKQFLDGWTACLWTDRTSVPLLPQPRATATTATTASEAGAFPRPLTDQAETQEYNTHCSCWQLAIRLWGLQGGLGQVQHQGL